MTDDGLNDHKMMLGFVLSRLADEEQTPEGWPPEKVARLVSMLREVVQADEGLYNFMMGAAAALDIRTNDVPSALLRVIAGFWSDHPKYIVLYGNEEWAKS